MTKYDFIALGDLTTDAFIKLKDARVTCDINHESCMISMRFADKIPYEEVVIIPAVGNSANASVAAARLGLKSALVSEIGGDQNGRDALAALKVEKVGEKFIHLNKKLKTNFHFVLSYEGERTILIKHEDYPYKLPAIGEPKWLYLSSAGEHNLLKFHKQVERYLDKHKGVKLAFQPGAFQMRAGLAKMAGTYKRTEILFLNKEEAQRVLATKEGRIKQLLDGLAKRGPKMVLITDGRRGAYLKEGKQYWQMPMYPDPKPPLERTGAGDAFSATFTVALAKGKSIEEALRWAPVNSMSVVQYVGAREGLLSERKLKALLQKAPKGYKPTRI